MQEQILQSPRELTVKLRDSIDTTSLVRGSIPIKHSSVPVVVLELVLVDEIVVSEVVVLVELVVVG